MGFVYLIRNKINGKIYVGQTSISIEKRWRKHLSNSRCVNNFDYAIYRAIRKYGSDAFTIESLASADTLEELNVLERHFVSEYKSFNPKQGYNMTQGGDGVHGNEESRKKQCDAWKHRAPCSQETREKLSAAKMGTKRTVKAKTKTSSGLLKFYSDPEKRKQHSMRMQQWWDERKSGGGVPSL